MKDFNKKICYFLAFLNMVDAISTMILVYAGWATEANPIMDLLLNKSFLLFFSCKLTLSIAIIFAGKNWGATTNKLIQFLLWFATFSYVLVIFAHLAVIFKGLTNV